MRVMYGVCVKPDQRHTVCSDSKYWVKSNEHLEYYSENERGLWATKKEALEHKSERFEQVVPVKIQEQVIMNRIGNNHIPVELKILDDRVPHYFPLPEFTTLGSAGMDLRAAIRNDLIIQPHQAELIGTGIAIHIADPTICGVIIPRSGIGHRHGIVLGNGVGLIDSDYQGELKVSLLNRSDQHYIILPGSRIAQIVFLPIVRPIFQVVDSFDTSERGIGGFGSTGVA